MSYLDKCENDAKVYNICEKNLLGKLSLNRLSLASVDKNSFKMNKNVRNKHGSEMCM